MHILTAETGAFNIRSRIQFGFRQIAWGVDATMFKSATSAGGLTLKL
jgi:hypothetical protein